MKKCRFLLSLILTLSLLTGLCAPSALATDVGKGFYVGAGFGATITTDDDDDLLMNSGISLPSEVDRHFTIGGNLVSPLDAPGVLSPALDRIIGADNIGLGGVDDNEGVVSNGILYRSIPVTGDLLRVNVEKSAAPDTKIKLEGETQVLFLEITPYDGSVPGTKDLVFKGSKVEGSADVRGLRITSWLLVKDVLRGINHSMRLKTRTFSGKNRYSFARWATTSLCRSIWALASWGLARRPTQPIFC